MTDGITNIVQHVVRPLDLSKGRWVSADGLPVPIYFPDEDPPESVWYGCGDSHQPDTDSHDEGCGTAFCHGRVGDDR